MHGYISNLRRVVNSRYERNLKVFKEDEERIRKINEEYERVICVLDLLKEKKPIENIARQLNYDVSTIQDWVFKKELPEQLGLCSFDISSRKEYATKKYNQKISQLNGNAEMLKRLKKDYDLAMRVFDLMKTKSRAETSRITGVPKKNIGYWLRGGLPCSLSRSPPSYLLKISYRKSQATRRYNQKAKQLKGDAEKLARLQENYTLVMRTLDLIKNYPLQDVSKITGVNPTTLSDWASGRKLPRSMRLNPSRSNKINKQKLAKSLDFLYLLGVYQPRVQAVSLRMRIMSRHDWLEEKVFDCMQSIFGDNNSQQAMFQSKDLMACVTEITDDNRSFPESLFYPRENIQRKDLERVYLQGVLDSRASITRQKRKLKRSESIREKPVIFVRVRNSSLLEKIKGLLAKHSIISSYNEDKRDGRRCLCINEFNSVKICRKYMSRSPKKERLSEFIEYHEDLIKNDLLGKSSKRIQEAKQEKEKDIVKCNISLPRIFRSSRRRGKFNKKAFKVYR